MSINTKELCQWLREHSSGAYRLSAEAATVIEELERENARLAAELASRNPSEPAVVATQGVLKPRAKGWYQCPRCDRLHAQMSNDSPLVQAHKVAVASPTMAPAASVYRHAPVEWTWKDTLEFVRKDFLSSEMYHKLREDGSFDFNKRQLTNLLNGAFEYYLAMPEVLAGLKSAAVKLPPMFEYTATGDGYSSTAAYSEGWNSCLAATMAINPTAMPVTELAAVPNEEPNADDVSADTGTVPASPDEQGAAILAWWIGKRPFGWSEEEHLDEPTAFCTGPEKPLALIAVQLAKAQRA